MRKIISVLALLVASGCASTMESLQIANTQNLLIQTPNVDGAECRLSDKGGRKWNLWETPGTVAVQEGHAPLVIICSKKGFKTSVLTINEHKEELLTIDGQRIDVSVYGDFPTKFPRLVPAAIKETAGFMQDPTGSLSTTYPNSVLVWMEPKKWESEEQMRAWAFDREVADRAEFINEEETKRVHEARQLTRRAEKEARERKFQNFTKNLKKGVNPAPLIGQGFKNTTKIINPVPSIERTLEKGVGNPLPAVEGVIKKGITAPIEPIQRGIGGADIDKAQGFLTERKEKKEKIRQQRALEDAEKKAKNAKPGNYSVDEMPQDKNAPQDIFEMKDSSGSRYEKVYTGDDNSVKYDENGNRITK